MIDGKKTDLYTLKNKQRHGREDQQLRRQGRGATGSGQKRPTRRRRDGLRYDRGREQVRAVGRLDHRPLREPNRERAIHDGRQPYQLSINNGPNHLHGGTKGARFRVFDAKQLDDHALQLNYTFKDDEEGYPGNCSLKVIYTVTGANALKVAYEAVVDKKTIVNFSNHTNFNLSGDPGKSIEDHVVTIDADTFTRVVEPMA